MQAETEVFVGKLDRNASEDDVREVFSIAGDIVEVRTAPQALFCVVCRQGISHGKRSGS